MTAALPRQDQNCATYSIAWPQVVQRFEAKPTIGLFLDFDGNAGAASDASEECVAGRCHAPDTLGPGTQPAFRVWIVSGRRRADVARAEFASRGIRYLGLHGWEGRSAGANHRRKRASSDMRQKAGLLACC